MCIKDRTSNEKFWKSIRDMYTVCDDFINLNNGGVSPHPKVVREAARSYTEFANTLPSYNLWQVQEKSRESIRELLANMLGCPTETLAINRNATEGLETVIFGLNLKIGDEVVLSDYEYPSVKNAWLQRAKRDGIKLKWIKLDLPSEDTPALIEQYKQQVSSNTKVLQLTHLINWNGQLMPVKEIADAVHRDDLEIIVDAAHSFAQINYKITDWKIDYLCASLHKWLCASLGTGILYVKKDKIKALYPMFASPAHELAQIQKFEHFGTRSLSAELSIADAIAFHDKIGTDRKQKRLYYLKNHLYKKLSKKEGLHFFTPASADFSGALLSFRLEGKKNILVAHDLYKNHNIHVGIVGLNGMNAIRVSPNVYTLKSDLNKFIKVIDQLIS